MGRLCGLSTVVTPAGASYQCIERYILTQTVKGVDDDDDDDTVIIIL